jgi:hypothetical protein
MLALSHVVMRPMGKTLPCQVLNYRTALILTAQQPQKNSWFLRVSEQEYERTAILRNVGDYKTNGTA